MTQFQYYGFLPPIKKKGAYFQSAPQNNILSVETYLSSWKYIQFVDSVIYSNILKYIKRKWKIIDKIKLKLQIFTVMIKPHVTYVNAMSKWNSISVLRIVLILIWCDSFPNISLSFFLLSSYNLCMSVCDHFNHISSKY